MIYGNKFLNIDVVNEASVEEKIDRYKKAIDEAVYLLDLQCKSINIMCDIFDKEYKIYMNINEKNVVTSLKEIERISNDKAAANKIKKIVDEIKEKNSNNHKELSGLSNGLFNKFAKSPEADKLRKELKDKLNKYVEITNGILKKYDMYYDTVYVYTEESKVIKSIYNKSSQIIHEYMKNYSNKDQYYIEIFENPDGNIVEEDFWSIGRDLKEVLNNIKFYK